MKETIISKQENGIKLVIDIEKEAEKYILVSNIELGYTVFYLFAREGKYHQELFEKFIEENKQVIIDFSETEFEKNKKKVLERGDGYSAGLMTDVCGGGWIEFDKKIALSGRSGQYGCADREILEKIKKEFEEDSVEIEIR